MRAPDPLTTWMHRAGWVAWVLLALALIGGLGQEDGKRPPYAGPMGAVDIAVVAWLWCAVIAALVAQVWYSSHSRRYEYVARWLVTMAAGIIAYRLSVQIITLGEVMAPAITLLAFALLGLGMIVSALGAMGHGRKV